MTAEKRLLDILLAITRISSDHRLSFQEKLHELLREVLACMEARRGSIMLLKGRKALEVVASTNPDLIGVKQPLEGTSPSGWVVKHKSPLYIDKDTEEAPTRGNPGTYRKSAFLIVPILRQNKVIGVINVTDKVGDDVFEKEEQDILLRITGQVIDTLELERLTASLKKSKKTLSNKNRKLKKLEKLRTDLFNMLIHDLKGPISEIVANLDILSYTIDDENRPFVETAQTGCDTLQSMVSNLLDIARLEDGRLNLIHEKIPPGDLVKEALGRLHGLALMKEVTLATASPPAEEIPLSADRGILLRVLQNLITNAIQYSPPEETIEVGFSYVDGGRIRFFVADRGPGVPLEYREAIFDKYMQLEKKADGRIYTTGLGLTFCRLAVKAHRGKIGVEDHPPRGSRFWFTLPLEIQDKAATTVSRKMKG